MFIPSSDKEQSWQNFKLIVPTVSVGNVSQLAADLIISTLRMERVGYILHPSLLPCVGSNPYAHKNSATYMLTTCCEVYESLKTQIVVIQQRTPIIKGHRKEYADWLAGWIKEKQFHQVVILTSTFAQERLDHQLSGSPFRILQSQKMEELQKGELFSTKMDWKELEPRHSFPASTPLQLEADPDIHKNKVIYMPGSGIAKMLYEKCQDLPVLVLMMFVSEGDNAQDALAMVEQLNQWLTLITQQNEVDQQQSEDKDVVQAILKWKVPMSWRLVFGSQCDPKLYQ